MNIVRSKGMVRTVFRSLLFCVGLLMGCPAPPSAGAGRVTANPNSTAQFNVNGTYNWGENPATLGAGTNPVGLAGTITFQQNGLTLQVISTTHVAPGNRALIGTGSFVGNLVDIVMVPRNGDTDYQATVRLIFSEDDGGLRFQADFSDTNGDVDTAFGIHR